MVVMTKNKLKDNMRNGDVRATVTRAWFFYASLFRLLYYNLILYKAHTQRAKLCTS